MAGHSKWANIKYRKGRADQLKGKLFSKIIKEIVTAVKLGGMDRKSNFRLKLAIQKARACNMPNENIERNIKKASSGEEVTYSDILYEIYGKGGVGILVELTTDNKSRIISDIRTLLSKKGGVLANSGSVMYHFDHLGVLQVSKKMVTEEALFAAITQAGAQDFEVEEDRFIISSSPENLFQVKEAIDTLKIPCEEVGLEYVPKVLIECSAEEERANLKLIEALEELDDIQAVYHNMKISLL